MKNLLICLSVFLLMQPPYLSAQDILAGEEIFDGVVVQSEVWDGSFAFGLNGTTGNSENLDINLNVDASRETDMAITDLLLNYFYASNQAGATKDRLYVQGRQDRKLANPNFSWYYSAFYEQDRFQAFDYRLGAHTGLGILLYEYGDRFLKARVGGGASREVGGIDDDWIPELQFGLDWERHISERTRLFANTDMYPNVTDFGDYRINTQAGIETLLDPALDMRLRAFIFNWYDSTPDPGDTENSLDYGLSLVFGF